MVRRQRSAIALKRRLEIGCSSEGDQVNFWQVLSAVDVCRRSLVIVGQGKVNVACACKYGSRKDGLHGDNFGA